MVSRACGPGLRTGEKRALVLSGGLEYELRLLCRGLACSRLRFLEMVSTTVRLPDETVRELALRWLCDDLAAEFGLTSAVGRGADGWTVRFSRVPLDAEGEAGAAARDAARPCRGLRGGLGRIYAVARVLGRGMQLANQRRHAGRSPAWRGAE